MTRLLLTKFEAWKYEDEVRVFIELKEEQKRGCHYFADLDDDFQPASLIPWPEMPNYRPGDRKCNQRILHSH